MYNGFLATCLPEYVLLQRISFRKFWILMSYFESAHVTMEAEAQEHKHVYQYAYVAGSKLSCFSFQSGAFSKHAMG